MLVCLASLDLVIFLSSLMIMDSKISTQSSKIALLVTGRSVGRLLIILLVLGMIMSGPLRSLKSGGPIGAYAFLLIY